MKRKVVGVGKITQTIEETTKYMWRNQKNRLFMLIMLGLMLVYVLLFAPDFHSNYDQDMEELRTEMTGNAVQAQNAKDNGHIVPSIMTGTTAYIEQEFEFGAQRELYTTIKHGDIYRYLELKDVWAPTTTDTDIASLFYDIFGEDPLFIKNQAYREQVPNLNFHVVHEITSLQQIHLFLIGMGPLILLSGLIFMISEVHTKDLTLSTQKSGLPLRWQGYLLVQSLTALGFVLAFYAVFFGVFYLVNGLLHGFGGLFYPISLPFTGSGLTIGWFLLRTLPYIFILFILFTRLNTLISLWTGQAVVSMGLLIFIVFFSKIYMDAYTGDVLPFNLAYLPTSYLSFGKIIIGEHGLTTGIADLDIYMSGLVVLGITLAVTELILFVTSKRMTRQKYIAWGAN